MDTSGPSTDTGSPCTGTFTVTIGSLPTYEAERLCPGAVHRYELPGVRVDVTLAAPDCTAVEMALEPSGTTIGGCGGVGSTATALEVRHVQGPAAPYAVYVAP